MIALDCFRFTQILGTGFAVIGGLCQFCFLVPNRCQPFRLTVRFIPQFWFIRPLTSCSAIRSVPPISSAERQHPFPCRYFKVLRRRENKIYDILRTATDAIV